MKKKIVAIQGIRGAFHEEATYKYFGNNVEVYECNSFKMLCDALNDGTVDYATMAIENTVAGSLLANYSLLRDYHFKIIGETFLHIRMNLMALPGVKIEDLKFIISHPIALRQSYEYLYSLRHAKLIETDDTAESAKQIADEQLKDTAAVAGFAAAEMYGMNILERDIQTNKQNYTRFLILAREGVQREENNKASICFEVGHKVGALSEILNIFASHFINLTKIQSTPILGKPYEYSFHVDLEWDNTEQYSQAILEALKCASNLSVLGEYRKGLLFDIESEDVHHII